MRDVAARRSADDALRLGQYGSDANLSARMRLHRCFGTNPKPWHAWLFERLELAGSCDLLDVGCGNAALWRSNRSLLPSGLRAALLDFSTGMLAAAREAVAGSPAAFRPVCAHAARLPFGAASFDAVLAAHMLYHVEDVERALSEFRRVLRPGGVLFASTNQTGHLAELDAVATAVGLPNFVSHTDRFDLEGGAARIAHHFERVEVTRYPNHLEVTDARAALDYLASVAPPTPEQAHEAQSLVQREIDRRGYFHVTIETGVIVAKRAGFRHA